ncbi:hypothetical protein N7519_003013 [Penicillium mononematosum]|uniref:uncharacterized protein n=1 Tax=Penicillium mononematosum TaxID=268346 RepID=UPI002547BE37|nr:uncharacterized protein N7519_003013 [Penicillium mononematosum]KAJ6188105.1 hypothetical protein N7519_003013 [Penicillium mononematosum]
MDKLGHAGDTKDRCSGLSDVTCSPPKSTTVSNHSHSCELEIGVTHINRLGVKDCPKQMPDMMFDSPMNARLIGDE